MAMIDETALENRRVQQSHGTDAESLATNHRWHIGRLITYAAGFIVVVVVGGAIIGSWLGRREPAVVAADSAPNKPVVPSTTTAEKPVERSLPAAEPDGSEPIGVKERETAEGGNETSTALAAKPDEPPEIKPAAAPPEAEPAAAPEAEPATAPSEAKPASEPAEVKSAATPPEAEPAAEPPDAKLAAEAPVESPGSGVKAENDGPTRAPASAKATRTDLDAHRKDPPPQQAAADTRLSLAPESKAGSTVDQPAVIRIARLVSDANMRAGPSNSQAVVVAIPKGTAVEVINCRAWCEVIFSGKRGWVYKGFVEGSETSHKR